MKKKSRPGKAAKSGNASKPARSPRKPADDSGNASKPASSPRKSAEESPDAHADPPAGKCPIVGIGASAGGLEAFTQLLRALKADTGMAFVLVQHLAPKHESMLPELLASATHMPVEQVQDGMVVRPNHVYVIPPNVNMGVADGRLSLRPRAQERGLNLPIDFFFRNLAADQKSRAVGVILSGTASDGVQGLKEIKAEGGITLAQDPKTAKYDGMPRAAIGADAVDLVLSPEELAAELARIARHPYLSRARARAAEEATPESDGDLSTVFALLRRSTGVDFTLYKAPTVHRRIKRRMALHRLEKLAEYVRYLQRTPAEVALLFQDILIHVTGFFRDPEAFDALRDAIFPELFKNRRPDAPVRIWVPGCSTGEEVYSIAMCLLEHLGERSTGTVIQIFATDVSEHAINVGRGAIYPESISADVSPERLRRFFARSNGGYRVAKPIRDMCVFARQDVTRDPPFSNLDLISCRNLLIYLGQPLQKRVLSTFHYALKPTGYLMLGTSESIGGHSELFGLEDRKHKIYRKKSIASALHHFHFTAGVGYEAGKAEPAAPRPPPERPRPSDIQRAADRLVLGRFGPPGVVVDEDFRVVEYRGQTGLYLEPPPGEPSLSVLKMARPGLTLELRAALQQAKRRDAVVRRHAVPVKSNGWTTRIDLEVHPLKPNGDARHFLVLFEEVGRREPPAPAEPKRGRGKRPRSEVDRLNEELTAAREYVQTIVQDQESTNQELQSANEEILSANEELQSTNEELETAKEELQSTNEELNTVNEELQNRNAELGDLNSDLNNLLAAVNLPVVIVGADLRIRRFTPAAERLFNIIPSDVGRPISDFKSRIELPDLDQQIARTMEHVEAAEVEVRDVEGRWYLLRIRPYKRVDNRIDGAVLALVDIDAVRQSRVAAEEARDYSEALVDTIREPLLVLDDQLRVESVNRSFYKIFQMSPAETVGRLVYELGNGQFNIPRLRSLLEEILPKNSHFDDFAVEHEFAGLGIRKMLLNARRLELAGTRRRILLAIEDVSDAPGPK